MAKITIAGRLGNDPEISEKFTKFSVAESGYDFQKKQKATHWFNVTAFGKTAELVNNHVRKGNFIVVYGRCEPWKKGEKQGFNFIAESVVLSGRSENSEGYTPPKVEHKPMDFDDDSIPF